jgi:antitoxin PrlF
LTTGVACITFGITPMPQLTAKSQVTIPKEAREALGVEPGDSVEFRVTGSRVEVVRSETLAFDAGEAVFGRYSSGEGHRSEHRKELVRKKLRETRPRR